jgi:hypothetical protein
MLNQKWIAAIFEKLARRYAYKWHSMVGETERDIRSSMREWGEVLNGLTADEVQAGFIRLDEEAPAMAPTALEFKALCRSKVPEKHVMHRPYRALPRPKADKDLALEHVQRMKEALR